MDWLNKLVFGIVMISLFKLMPVIKPLLPVLGAAFDGLVSIVGWLANAAMTLIDWMLIIGMLIGLCGMFYHGCICIVQFKQWLIDKLS